MPPRQQIYQQNGNVFFLVVFGIESPKYGANTYIMGVILWMPCHFYLVRRILNCRRRCLRLAWANAIISDGGHVKLATSSSHSQHVLWRVNNKVKVLFCFRFRRFANRILPYCLLHFGLATVGVHWATLLLLQLFVCCLHLRRYNRYKQYVCAPCW